MWPEIWKGPVHPYGQMGGRLRQQIEGRQLARLPTGFTAPFLPTPPLEKGKGGWSRSAEEKKVMSV